MHDTLPLLRDYTFPALRRTPLDTVQVNLGYRCNQACLHCHVNASPKRTEMMTLDTVRQVIALLSESDVRTLDLTGGAPEMNPHFRLLVRAARQQGLQVIDRCNLSILVEPGYADLADFLATERVEIVASLPCYLEETVDRQRGSGIFAASIRALGILNGLGYGQPDSGLILNLVFNPQGDQLPPAQDALESAYHQELKQRYGIVFNRLFALANMPIQRFGSTLISNGQFRAYMDRLIASHNPAHLAQVMCRHTISIDWQGYVYDCDFNQMLQMVPGAAGGGSLHISALDARKLEGRPINTAGHCYGCTAGAGSSCGGALAPAGFQPTPGA
jgi:radical SAM/Cys-rich protein